MQYKLLFLALIQTRMIVRFKYASCAKAFVKFIICYLIIG